ncbi:cytidine deaminase [Nakamurella sp. PAMC28650]|nr:cytidine deaminase [Nakamurella sp. PAMC28650]
MGSEDLKLVTLARGAKGRAGSPQGAAVRDEDGRTYAAAGVALPSLKLTALQAAVAIAVASGATGLEAAVVVGGAGVDDDSLAAAREFAAPVVLLADDAGVVRARITP